MKKLILWISTCWIIGIYCISSEINGLFAGGSAPGVVYKYLGGNQWEVISPSLGYAVLSLVEYDGYLWAGTTSEFGGWGGVGRIYRYDGSSWTLVGDNLDNAVCSLAVYKGELYAGTAWNGMRLYKYTPGRTNCGIPNWTRVVDETAWTGTRALYVVDNYLLMGDILWDYIGHWDGENFYRDQLVTTGSCIYDFQKYDDYLYAAAYGGRLWYSKNVTDWEVALQYYDGNMWELEVFDGKFYMAYNNGELREYSGVGDLRGRTVYIAPDGIISMLSTGLYLYFGTGGDAIGYGGDAEGVASIYKYNGEIQPELISSEGVFGTGVQVLYISQLRGIPIDFRFSRDLSFNNHSPEVRYLQILLNNIDPETCLAKSGPGSPGNETTKFGALTLEAVKRFQKKYLGIPNPTGYVGPATRQKLNEILDGTFTDIYKAQNNLLSKKERKLEIWRCIKDLTGSYLPTNFPVEIVLAVATHETGDFAHWNNEHIADDWGRGIMQITSDHFVGAGGVNARSNVCMQCKMRKAKIFCSMYYSNTSMGIEANIRDGLFALGEKYRDVNKHAIKPPENYTEEEVIWISTVQRYNGFRRNPSKYIYKIGKTLIRLADGEFGIFPGFNEERAKALGEKFIKAYNERITLYSPAELYILDNQGNITGLMDGVIKEEIPNSIYDKKTKTAIIFFPSHGYRYIVKGLKEGVYTLIIEFFVEGNSVAFSASEIPLSTGAIHQYSVNWDALARGEEGVILQIDINGDGVFERTIRAGNELSGEDFGIVPPGQIISLGPHPVSSEGCIFWLNLPEDAVEATLKIFDVDGALLVSIPLDPKADRCPETGRWIPQDAQGRLLGTGLYLYLVEIVHADGTVTYSPVQKMVIQR